jgi:uncharacterized protein
MNIELIELIKQLNPWISNPQKPIIEISQYIRRQQTKKLLSTEWDSLWTILTGPRQAGKTTIGKIICQQLLQQKRFTSLLYLNCDHLEIRQWLKTTLFLKEVAEQFKLKNFILFIDEVQRLENPGLLLKAIADLKLPIKLIATGSSQLEIKSKVQEFLTGRHIEVQIYPLSYSELKHIGENIPVYGCFPAIVKTTEKTILLQQLYNNYINKDIIEILKVSRPDIIQKLITLLAHSSGQLVNYNQLAVDCKSSIPTIQNYLSILEKSYAIKAITPYVGNKRKEVTSNPIYYFIDNGFRNQALRNFMALDKRTDIGFLIENAMFQELLKYNAQRFNDLDIHYWRTQSGAEVDFILYKNAKQLIPIEVKYRNLNKINITKSFRSFVDAYSPKTGIFITKDFLAKTELNGCVIHFIPFEHLTDALDIIAEIL